MTESFNTPELTPDIENDVDFQNSVKEKIISDINSEIDRLLSSKNYKQDKINVSASLNNTKRAYPDDTAFQKRLIPLLQKLFLIENKRSHLAVIRSRIEKLEANVGRKSWELSKEQRNSIEVIKFEIKEARRIYTDDAIFLGIIDRIELHFDRLFTI